MNRVRASLTGAALGFLLSATAIGLAIDAPHLLILHFHHAETTGRVVRVIPNSHGLTEIAYSVDGTQYTREVPFYWISDPHSQGERLRIYYDPNDPTIVAAAPADQIIMGQFPSWIAGSLLLGPLFGWGVAENIVGRFASSKKA